MHGFKSIIAPRGKNSTWEQENARRLLEQLEAPTKSSMILENVVFNDLLGRSTDMTTYSKSIGPTSHSNSIDWIPRCNRITWLTHVSKIWWTSITFWPEMSQIVESLVYPVMESHLRVRGSLSKNEHQAYLGGQCKWEDLKTSSILWSMVRRYRRRKYANVGYYHSSRNFVPGTTRCRLVPHTAVSHWLNSSGFGCPSNNWKTVMSRMNTY